MSEARHRYFILNKPYNMVSQFVSPHAVRLLSELSFNFPPGTHALGRLDNNSEGLLVLTTNKRLTKLLFQSTVPHKRIYLVQINNILSNENLLKLRNGVTIKIAGGVNYITPPCKVDIVEDPNVYGVQFDSASNYGKHTWVRITLFEGKYHQVRKMFGSVRHRCKRLVRVAIEDLTLSGLTPGEIKEIDEEDIFRFLKLAGDQSFISHV